MAKQRTIPSRVLWRLIAGSGAQAAAVALGALTAQPIYRTSWLWLVAGVGFALGAAIAWARARWQWNPVTVIAVSLAAFMLSVVPVAAPQSLSTGLLRGFIDALAAVALGWKQVLTLTLPIGTYRTVLVPFFIVVLVSTLLTLVIAGRAGKAASFAAIPLLAPVAYGTIFGASAVSDPVGVGPLTLHAPRETAQWLAVALIAAAWVMWVSGSDRRRALRLGRLEGETPIRRGSVVRGLVAAGIVVVCLLAAAIFAPALDADARAVPRDAVDPELVIRERPSPLSAYRESKRDATLDGVLFSLSADRGLPERIRLAVLDAYDGTDFHVSDGAAGRYTRYPSGEPLVQGSDVTVTIGEEYADIWAPIAELGAPPVFEGDRGRELADGFYVNRATESAIVVTGDASQAATAGQRAASSEVLGLREGDAYTAEMETATETGALGAPVSSDPLLDLESTPQLERWIAAQGESATQQGLDELLERLRERGYLSHSLTDEEGERVWIERLSEQYGTRFEMSAGGHSLARIEDLFTQMNDQQQAAGEGARASMLVAGVGDDEQFAAAGALIARGLGYDSRVVVGVRTETGVPGVPACERECTGETLAAWIEVRGDAGNWVPYDVTPQVEQRPELLEEGEQLPEYPTEPDERDADEVDPPVGLGDQTDADDTDDTDEETSWLWPALRIAGLSLATAALLALPFLFLPIAKRLRTKRRRRARDPEVLALGAWDDMLDAARDDGLRIPRGATRRRAAAVLATDPAEWAAREVDRAVFSGERISADDAKWVWDAATADRDERRTGMSRWQRLRSTYSLRSYGIEGTRREPLTGESEPLT